MSDALRIRCEVELDSFRLGIDVELPARGITGIFGDSGSGKTTLIRCIAGLQANAQGTISLRGESWQNDQEGLFVPPYKRPIGYIFQEARLFPHMSVGDNLRYGLKRKNGSTDDEALESVVSLLGLQEFLKRKPESLSGGEQQRVAIGRALVTSPRILVMDEPLSSLDHRRKAELIPYLDRLHEKLDIPVLYVSHSLEEMQHLADHMLVLDEGRVAACGPASEILPDTIREYTLG